jgi:CRISPR-associated protein Cas8b1/Cst1 subtype I-B
MVNFQNKKSLILETKTPMEEIVMIETQTSVVSDVKDTKQLHTHAQQHKQSHALQHIFSVLSAADVA